MTAPAETAAAAAAATPAKPRIRVMADAVPVSEVAPPKAMATAYEAAALDDPAMLHWTPPAGSADADLIPEMGVMVPRARDLGRNSGIGSGAIQTYRDNIIGSVLRLVATPDYMALGQTKDWAREWSQDTQAKFRSWAETTECDAGRTLNLLGMATQSLAAAMVNGDACTIPKWRPRRDSVWGTRLMNVESDRLAAPSWLAADPRMRGGVEIDTDGAPTAYWLRKTHPGDRFRPGGYLAALEDYDRIPAFDAATGRRRFLHLYDPERPGQSRGKTVFASVIKEFRLMNRYTGAEIHAAAANALVAAFIESNMDQEAVSDLFRSHINETSGQSNPEEYWRTQVSDYNSRLKSGAVIPLPVGAKMQGFQPARPNAAFESFVNSFMHIMAAGLNLPYELFAKDFSKTNYSSARAALLEAWRYFKGRRAWFVAMWLQPVYELWLEEAINTGRVEAPGFYDNKYAWCRSRWIFAGRGWVDPVKEAQAAEIRMDIGLSTLEEEAAEQGKDWEEILEQRSVERAKMQELGLLEAAEASRRRPLAPNAPTDADAVPSEESPPGGNEPPGGNGQSQPSEAFLA